MLRNWRPILLFGLIAAGLTAWPVISPARQGPMQPPPPAQPRQQAPPPPAQAPQPGYSITVNVPVVNVDLVVTDDSGNYLEQLRKENFRIIEDGVPQVITNFGTADMPITVAIIVENSRNGYYFFTAKARDWATVFLSQMKPVDWVALQSFDSRTNLEVDFTHNPRDIMQGLASLGLPISMESNFYDAVIDTEDRMRGIKGKKAILALASGRDTFSKLTFDRAMARLKESDTPIFCVGTAEQFGLAVESSGRIDAGTNSVSAIAAQQQMKAFSEVTGGRSWFPRFDAELIDIMKDVAASLRFEYSLAYTPSNQATDGKYRKIKVELLDNDGKPAEFKDAKGKKIKYIVHARQGYVAPRNSILNN
jgi:VWFA-related protein